MLRNIARAMKKAKHLAEAQATRIARCIVDMTPPVVQKKVVAAAVVGLTVATSAADAANQHWEDCCLGGYSFGCCLQWIWSIIEGGM